MFVIVRIVLFLIVFAVGLVLIHKSRAKSKKLLRLALAGVTFALCVLTMFLPLENAFISFDSPVAAFEYYLLDNSGDKVVVEGTQCDLVVNRKNGTDTYLIVPKDNNGWNVGLGIDTRQVALKSVDGIVVTIHRYKNTDDYFVTVLNTDGGELALADEAGTAFVSTRRQNDALKETIFTYYGHISVTNGIYRLLVNDKIIEVVVN